MADHFQKYQVYGPPRLKLGSHKGQEWSVLTGSKVWDAELLKVSHQHIAIVPRRSREIPLLPLSLVPGNWTPPTGRSQLPE